MPVDVRIPQLGESVSEGVIVRWLKADGADVRRDEPLLEIETEKASMEIVAETDGRLHVVEPVGARVAAGAVVGRIDETDAAAPPPAEAPARPEAAPPAETAPPSPPPPRERAPAAPAEAAAARPREPAPDAQRAGAPAREEAAPRRPSAPPAADGDGAAAAEADVERVPMSELRRAIARRLVEAQQTAAILTTFNEIDCGALLELRRRYREAFRTKHDVDLGLVSLFARAAVLALRDVPVVNARIDDGEIVQHRRVHLGIAVATRRGLVVPVVRKADTLSLAALERTIAAVAVRARDGKLAPDDLAGGTFTITNGGVFGSLLSTPLLNPPQSGILGMHKIEDRPVARDGQVVIRPMMYVALSYDHRLVDGEQAVTFLVRVKQYIEDPARMVLDV